MTSTHRGLTVLTKRERTRTLATTLHRGGWLNNERNVASVERRNTKQQTHGGRECPRKQIKMDVTHVGRQTNPGAQYRHAPSERHARTLEALCEPNPTRASKARGAQTTRQWTPTSRAGRALDVLRPKHLGDASWQLETYTLGAWLKADDRDLESMNPETRDDQEAQALGVRH